MTKSLQRQLEIKLTVFCPFASQHAGKECAEERELQLAFLIPPAFRTSG